MMMSTCCLLLALPLLASAAIIQIDGQNGNARPFEDDDSSVRRTLRDDDRLHQFVATKLDKLEHSVLFINQFLDLQFPDTYSTYRDGGWSEYSDWWACSDRCEGKSFRFRQCNNPSPRAGGKDCEGHSIDIKACNTHCTKDTSPAVQRVRLIGGARRSQGRVEILGKTEWETLCDVGFTVYDAAVVCRTLGYYNVPVLIGRAHYGEARGRIHQNLQCTGTEQDVSRCRGGQSEDINEACRHSDDISIDCEPLLRKIEKQTDEPSRITGVRLTGDQTPSRGRLVVEVDNSTDGSICADHFGVKDAIVVCKMINQRGGYEPVLINDEQPPRLRVLVDELQCTGFERSLDECHKGPIGQHSCRSNQAVVIDCRPDVRVRTTAICPKGYMDYRGTCYTGINQMMSYTQAKKACADKGSTVLEIRDQETLEIIQHGIKDFEDVRHTLTILNDTVAIDKIRAIFEDNDNLESIKNIIKAKGEFKHLNDIINDDKTVNLVNTIMRDPEAIDQIKILLQDKDVLNEIKKILYLNEERKYGNEEMKGITKIIEDDSIPNYKIVEEIKRAIKEAIYRHQNSNENTTCLMRINELIRDAEANSMPIDKIIEQVKKAILEHAAIEETHNIVLKFVFEIKRAIRENQDAGKPKHSVVEQIEKVIEEHAALDRPQNNMEDNPFVQQIITIIMRDDVPSDSIDQIKSIIRKYKDIERPEGIVKKLVFEIKRIIDENETAGEPKHIVVAQIKKALKKAIQRPANKEDYRFVEKIVEIVRKYEKTGGPTYIVFEQIQKIVGEYEAARDTNIIKQIKDQIKDKEGFQHFQNIMQAKSAIDQIKALVGAKDFIEQIKKLLKDEEAVQLIKEFFEGENGFDHLQNVFQNKQEVRVWLGLKREQGDFVLQSDGRRPASSHWAAPGQWNPQRSQRSKDCAVVRRDGRWEEVDCQTEAAVICQKHGQNRGIVDQL